MIMGFLHPVFASSSGSLCRLPAPVMHSGLRQGKYPAPQTEAGLKHPTVYFFKQHKAHILSMGYYAAF